MIKLLRCSTAHLKCVEEHVSLWREAYSIQQQEHEWRLPSRRPSLLISCVCTGSLFQWWNRVWLKTSFLLRRLALCLIYSTMLRARKLSNIESSSWVEDNSLEPVWSSLRTEVTLLRPLHLIEHTQWRALTSRYSLFWFTSALIQLHWECRNTKQHSELKWFFSDERNTSDQLSDQRREPGKSKPPSSHHTQTAKSLEFHK